MRKAFMVITLTLLAAISASAQDWAKQRVDQSPRRHEFVQVKAGARTVNCFLTYPEGNMPTTAVVVIHENMGLSDWARLVTDELAEAGYLAIAADLLSGMAPNGGGTSDFPNLSAITQAINRLPPEQITSDLTAVADHAAKLPAGNGKVAIAGFCWGGDQSFRFATNLPNLIAAFVFYGVSPNDKEAIARINCPVYGFYGGSDARVTATTTGTAQLMKDAGKTYEPVVYEGAGHGFMRSGDDPANTNQANKKARDDSWIRWNSILSKL